MSASIGSKWLKFYEAQLLGPKILYFFMFLQQYSFYSFRSVFFKENFGYDSKQIGVVFGFAALASFLGMTTWSRMSDLTGRPKMIFLLIVLGSFLSFIPIYFKSLFADPDYGFIFFVFQISLYSFFNFGMNPILSNAVLDIMNRAGVTDKSTYGRQVVFGSFAFILVNLVLGLGDAKSRGQSIFMIMPVTCALLCLAIILAFPGNMHQAQKKSSAAVNVAEKTTLSEKPSQQWWHVLRNPRFVLFLSVIFLTGCARTIMSAFLPYYYDRKLEFKGMSSSLLLVSGVLFEMAGFLWAPQISQMGPYWMLVLAQIFMVCRSWAYVFIPASKSYFWAVMFVELMKGAAFGLTHLAGVRVARESAPEGLEATAQGFYEGCYSQIPSILAVPLGGMLIADNPDKTDFSLLFWITAIGISLSCLTVISVFWQNGKLKLRKN